MLVRKCHGDTGKLGWGKSGGLQMRVTVTRRRGDLEVTLKIRRLLDLTGQHGGLRDVVSAARHCRSPLFRAARSGLVDTDDFAIADQAAHEPGRASSVTPRTAQDQVKNRTDPQSPGAHSHGIRMETS